MRIEPQDSCDSPFYLRAHDMRENGQFVRLYVRVELGTGYISIHLIAILWILKSVYVVGKGPFCEPRAISTQSEFLAAEDICPSDENVIPYLKVW